ncbi:hypothetical protein EIMP300_64450 [Escherichia coli]|uniref:Uncharacterized protein n=5 Tax=Gammaproteobacteria TaxID=1236 RepID=A0A8S0FWN6_ECOLX|nr:hypothetical protein EIMP300_64450 [Escherichia coli]
MITPQEARQRTRTLVEHYVNECECRDLTDVKHVLTALISMATQAIVATNGKEAALQVLMNTLTHTAEHEVPYRMETTAADRRPAHHRQPEALRARHDTKHRTHPHRPLPSGPAAFRAGRTGPETGRRGR